MYRLATNCRVCGTGSFTKILDLGVQPPANQLRLPHESVPATVPLELLHCKSCQTAQISATIPPSELFDTYLWVTGTSGLSRSYSETFAEQIDAVFQGLCRPAAAVPFAIEIASNDGTFLRRLLERNWRVLGIEPAKNIAKEAVASGVATLPEFFEADLAEDLLQQYGPADFVIARNVVPHVADIHSVISGLATIAGDSGIVVIEVHSAEVILDELHYDSIYHEHLFYFSMATLCALCERHGLYPFDAFRSPISGGSHVVFFSQDRKPPTRRLADLTDQDRDVEINSHDSWASFGASSIEHAAALRETIDRYSRSGKVVGYGASARSSTMLNFAGITNDEVVSVIDQNTLKQGRLTAGTDIPIVSPEKGLREIGSSGTVLLLAWNFEEEIVGELRGNGFHGDIIAPLPRSIRIL